jgi:hypothetical protein
MGAISVVCFFCTIPFPAIPVVYLFGLFAGTFVLGATYPIATAFIATKQPTYLQTPWDRPQWTANPFAMQGPLHGPHFFWPILFVGGLATGVRVVSGEITNDSAATLFPKMLQTESLFLIAIGLWLGISAAKGLFVKGYRDERKTEADVTTFQLVEIAAGWIWVFTLVSLLTVAVIILFAIFLG